MDLLSNIHSCEMCPDCEVLRTPRSRHCAICNQCVERFDHHCPYINNCVGIRNHNAFLAFIISLFMLIISVIISNILHLADPCKINDELSRCPLESFCYKELCHNQILELVVNILQLAFLSLFALPFVGFLGMITVKNFCNGKTTSEMYSRRARSQSLISQSDMTESQSLIEVQSVTANTSPMMVYKSQTNLKRRTNFILNCRDMCCRKRILSQKELW